MPTLLLQIPCDHHIEWHHGSRRSQKKAHWWKTSWVFLLTEIVINKQRKILCKAFFWIHLVVYVAVLTDGNFLVPLQSWCSDYYTINPLRWKVVMRHLLGVCLELHMPWASTCSVGIINTLCFGWSTKPLQDWFAPFQIYELINYLHKIAYTETVWLVGKSTHWVN